MRSNVSPVQLRFMTGMNEFTTSAIAPTPLRESSAIRKSYWGSSITLSISALTLAATLISWLERHDVEVYQRILTADRLSAARLNGHGNAIAQVYNHIILPLANARDKITQIRWGKVDFQSRFGRDPEGMWLAEAAVDYPTLEALVAEGIKFIVLAPSQAQRCRPMPTAETADPDWREVSGGQIDPVQPYRLLLAGRRFDRSTLHRHLFLR